MFELAGEPAASAVGIPPARESGHAPHTEEELRALLAQSRALGLIEPGEHLIAERGFEFAERRAREVMRPRGEIEFVTSDETLQAAARHAVKVGHTRLPLCAPDRGLDAPLGLIHAQDLLEATLERPDVPLEQLARPLGRVSEATGSRSSSRRCDSSVATWRWWLTNTAQPSGS